MAEKVKALSDYELDKTNFDVRKNMKQVGNLEVDFDSELGKGATAKVYLGQYLLPNQPKN